MKGLTNTIASVVNNVAEMELRTACHVFCYQPELPEEEKENEE